MHRYVIIGSGSGIGAAVARSLAGPAVELLLHTGENRERLNAVVKDCTAKGAAVDSCIGLTGDEALFQSVEAWAQNVPEAGLTGIVFAAGYAKLGSVTDTPVDALEQALQAMPIAFHRLVTMLAPKLAKDRGRIVCISAFGAHRSKVYSYAATAPAKAGLEAQVRTFAANLAPAGITVNAVVPGFVEKEPGTPSSMTPDQWQEVSAGIPMNRIGRREEVAALAHFLLSADAGYITGQSIHVNGGLTL